MSQIFFTLSIFAVFYAIGVSGCSSASERPVPQQQGYNITGLAAQQQGYKVTGLTDIVPGATSDSGTGITLLDVKKLVKQGEDGNLSIQGVPNTDYTITATYNNPRGSVTAWASSRAGDDGKVRWDWKVKGDTLPGTYSLIVSGGGKMITSSYTVIR